MDTRLGDVNVVFRKINCDDDWDWVTDKVPLLLIPDMTSILAIDKDTGDRLACCIMDTWTNSSCQIHFVIANPLVLRHGFFQEISRFVFDTSKRIKMIGIVPSDNERALRMDRKIGFVEVARIKDGHDFGVDSVVMELTRENCNFNMNED